jgi:hypothetical protein
MKKKKAQTLEVRKLERTLKCVLTPEEILTLGKDLAEKTQLASQIEADKKRVVKEFDAKIAEADAGIQLASGKIQNGYEYRTVKCTETIGEPDENKKTVRRLDTGEIVEIRELNAEEKQRVLEFEKEQAATDGAQ